MGMGYLQEDSSIDVRKKKERKKKSVVKSSAWGVQDDGVHAQRLSLLTRKSKNQGVANAKEKKETLLPGNL
jgi:hypothetical protein